MVRAELRPEAGSHHATAAGFRPDIQGLRALAVILVVLDHARIGPFHGGFIGVDVFFVISGFLITGLLLGEAERHGRISLLDFYARRAKRILPAATLVLAVTAVAGYFLLSGIQAVRLFKDTVWATFFAANIKFARDETDYFAQDDAIPPIQHYWSLAVEEQFYLVWPLVVLLLVALFRARGTGPPGGGARDRRDQPGVVRLGSLHRRHQPARRLLLHPGTRLGARARRRHRGGRAAATTAPARAARGRLVGRRGPDRCRCAHVRRRHPGAGRPRAAAGGRHGAAARRRHRGGRLGAAAAPGRGADALDR